ncbi:hypothetical protein SCHPADRAFT_993797 [Schizopora paradoxa]|uniref:Uncharacterized protein n=1 Tax=Schizopora paradoxa TaxID=27342 RepID=A0A0H2S2T4_9AGAM|nr:hypothetical protein SCHPADRAFT_993797 [Schizopora paradoxa]
MDVEYEDGNLLVDLFEVIARWLAIRDPILERWRGGLKPVNPMSYNDIQKIGTAGCSDLLSRTRKVKRQLKRLSDTLRELSTVVRAASDAVCANHNAVSNMCGLLSLPSELLSQIFQFVVDGTGDPVWANPTRSKAAVTLSHVSQYFRNTALSCAPLWSNICGSPEMAQLCLSQSEEALLDVAVTVGWSSNPVPKPYDMAFEQFITDALPQSKRWRSLDVHYKPKVWMFSEGTDVRQALSELDVRSLVSLCIRNDDEHLRFEDYHEFRHWNTPNLRHLIAIQYFPLALPNIANLTSLDVTLKPGQISLTSVHQEISRMENLESLSLKMGMGQPHNNDQLESFQTVELPKVRCLKIGMETQWPNWIDIYKSFFSSMSFPGAVDMHVKLYGTFRKIDDDNRPAFLSLVSEMESIIQHGMRFPRVEHFCLEVSGVNVGTSHTECFLGDQQGEIFVLVPLGIFPAVKHFTLSSNGILCAYPTEDPVTEENYRIPTLNTITVRISEMAAWGAASLIQKILSAQEERGDREEFRELVVINSDQETDAQDYIPKKVYTGDAAFEWYERRLSELDDAYFID